MWKIILQVAVAVGLDKWAKKKAVELAKKIGGKAKDKAADILKTANVEGEIVELIKKHVKIEAVADIYRPGQTVYHNGQAHRIVKLLSAGKGAATYEAKPE